MPEPTYEDRRAAAEAGFFGHAAGYVSALSSYVSARLQLAGLEVKEALIHYAIIAALAVIALVVIIFGYFFLCFAVVFSVAALIGTKHLWWLTLAMAILHFGGAVAALLIAKGKLAMPMFATTLDEFKKDQEWLTSTHAKRS